MDFIEFLANEAKQVGIIYHFTTVKNLEMIISGIVNNNVRATDSFEFLSKNDKISTTRNYRLPMIDGDLHISKGYVVRINFDGDKISNKFKIEPILGLKGDSSDIWNKNLRRVSISDQEQEEIIHTKSREFSDTRIQSAKLKDFVISIDVLTEDDAIISNIQRLIKENNLKISVNKVRKFEAKK